MFGCRENDAGRGHEIEAPEAVQEEEEHNLEEANEDDWVRENTETEDTLDLDTSFAPGPDAFEEYEPQDM